MNKTLDFIKQVFKGKSIARILFNWQVEKHCQNLKGRCLDLAAGINPSYQKYWSLDPDIELVTVDYNKNKNPDLIISFDQRFPLEDNSFDNIFLFNAIYIAKNQENILKEVNRVLRPGGKFFFNSPFIFNEAREPNDFRRLTSQGIELLLKQSGFNDFKIIPYGERFTVAAFLWHSFFLFDFIRFFVFLKMIVFDKLIPKKIKKKHPCPIGYFIIVKK